ncbi:MAG: trypsin-like peptidase domain-containing protein [Thermomicrobiales bacterium]
MSHDPSVAVFTTTPSKRRSRVTASVGGLLIALSLALGVQQFNPVAAQDALTGTPTATITVNGTNTTSGEQTFSVADVAAKANNAVVTIYTYTSQQQTGTQQFPGGGQSGNGSQGNDNTQNGNDSTTQNGTEQALGAGSGWIYDSAGHVITNNHVVEGADKFVVQFADGTQAEATLVGTDQFQDVAVLKLADGTKIPEVATVGDSSSMRAGDQVVAIGSPLGEFTNTVSEGIIGGLDRSLDTGEGYSLQNLIQHDAPISPGNSGGPLLNMEGQVIGMNVAKVEQTQTNGASASGLGFAIDGNTVKKTVDEIIKDNGNVAYPYLGIASQETPNGQEVMQVQADSPAAKAGLQQGDVITAVDGTTLDSSHLLQDELFQHKVGDTVTLTVNRNGQTVTLTVTLGQRPSGV